MPSSACRGCCVLFVIWFIFRNDYHVEAGRLHIGAWSSFFRLASFLVRLVQNAGLVEVIQDGFCRISIMWLAALARRILVPTEALLEFAGLRGSILGGTPLRAQLLCGVTARSRAHPYYHARVEFLGA